MDSNSGIHGVIIIEQFDIAEQRHPSLGMPILVQTGPNTSYIVVISSYVGVLICPTRSRFWNLVYMQDIEFAVNVQHDCITLGCPNSAIETIRQERRNTTIQRQVIQHRKDS